MAISFIEKIAYINKYAQGNKGYEATVKFAKGIDKYPNDKQETIKKAVDKAYADIKAVNKPATTQNATKPSKSKKAVDIKKVLAKFKAKVGTKAYKEATKGTTIKQDSERPALKKGKRFVTKKGYTTNQYGTFKNQVGTAYWETRANRFDVKQPPKSFPKLAKGGMTLKEFPIGYIEVVQERIGDYNKAQNILKKHGIKIDASKKFHTKGFADELYGEFNDGRETYIIKFDMNDAPNPTELKKDVIAFENKNPHVAVQFHKKYAEGGEIKHWKYDLILTTPTEEHHVAKFHSKGDALICRTALQEATSTKGYKYSVKEAK